MAGSPSVAAQIAVVCDTADAAGAPLCAVIAYAAAVWRATGTVPAHYATAVAAAEAQIGAENAAAIADWVAAQRGWIETSAAALDALRELGPPPGEVPAPALAAAAVAALLADAAGDPLAEIIWAGVCATAQWRVRFLAEEVLITEVLAADPIAHAAYLRLSSADGGRIATEVRRSLAHIDELAGEIAA
jgi:hypothetical protein